MTNTKALTRKATARLSALALLAALTLTLGAAATPLAGTAHAGGIRGGIVDRQSSVARDFEAAGSKPSVIKATGVIEPAGSKPSVAGGTR